MLFYLCLSIVFLSVCRAEKCLHPPPSPNFNNSLYAGRWYEVGKYQTFGGSIFQQGTVCTIATYDPYDMTTGGGDIGKMGIKSVKHEDNDICLRLLQQTG